MSEGEQSALETLAQTHSSALVCGAGREPSNGASGVWPLQPTATMMDGGRGGRPVDTLFYGAITPPSQLASYASDQSLGMPRKAALHLGASSS